MPRSRPASSPLSFHKHTGQYYVTRGGRRIHLGADYDQALKQYHRLALGQTLAPSAEVESIPGITVKELSNRFLATQQANWRNPRVTLQGYTNWLKRFLEDHRGLRADEFTVEMFAAWKLSLRERGYARDSINHFLGAVRALYRFGEDSGLLSSVPKLRRVRNEFACGQEPVKRVYTSQQIAALLGHADLQMKTMVFLGLNCGLGPKDIEDLRWEHIVDGRMSEIYRGIRQPLSSGT